MAKKRNVFDIDFVANDEGAAVSGGGRELDGVVEGVSDRAAATGREAARARRGPMASAITETAEASKSRADAEAAIRAENDALAHEHVRLKKLGLITDLIPTDLVAMTKLTRDRSPEVDADLEELKASIQSVGLSNPIRVEQTEGGFELIQGFRRLTAFRELAAETGDPRYKKIPAALVPRGEPLADLYRKMVDENLVRKDVSFGEMAALALSFAREAKIEPSDAVTELYASALKQKRSYIRQFVRLLDLLNGAVLHPEKIPRALGLELTKRLEASPDQVEKLINELVNAHGAGGDVELQILKRAAATPIQTTPKARPRASAKTSMRLSHADGEVRVLATDGRVELRLDRDFSSLSKVKLQAGVEALLKVLDQE